MAKDTPKPARVVKLFEPWAPPVLDLFDVASLQAVATGTASPDQQRQCMRVIVEKLAGVHQETYCPGANGARDSDYAQGKRRVGTMIVSFVNGPLKNFKDPDAASSEQG